MLLASTKLCLIALTGPLEKVEKGIFDRGYLCAPPAGLLRRPHQNLS